MNPFDDPEADIPRVALNTAPVSSDAASGNQPARE